MNKYRGVRLLPLFLAACGLQVAAADELTQMVEDSLSQLGYDTGAVDGEADVKTAIAVSQYQAEKGLDVTGEVSPQLAGMLAADAKSGSVSPASAPAAAPAQPAADPAALAAAQQACLQQKIAEQQAKQKQKKAFGKMLAAVSKTAVQYGGYDTAKTVSEVYTAGSSASDIAEAAKELGLTEQDIADCENP